MSSLRPKTPVENPSIAVSFYLSLITVRACVLFSFRLAAAR